MARIIYDGQLFSQLVQFVCAGQGSAELQTLLYKIHGYSPDSL